MLRQMSSHVRLSATNKNGNIPQNLLIEHNLHFTKKNSAILKYYLPRILSKIFISNHAKQK